MNVNFFWFRRDLRISDNRGLFAALTSGLPVIPVFIFDHNILDSLPKNDARVDFIHRTIVDLDLELRNLGSSLLVLHGDPQQLWKELAQRFKIQAVYFNHDLEPYAAQRDAAVKKVLEQYNVTMYGHKDHLIFEGNEILKDDGKPYTVFTPYKNKWLSKLHIETQNGVPKPLISWPSEKHIDQFSKVTKPYKIPSLAELGFESGSLSFPPKTVSTSLIMHYDQTRDYPAVPGTSKLGIHFRFGTISIREKAMKALKLNATYLNELIWRDFYAMILFHFPHTISEAFRPEYDKIVWLNDVSSFEKWKEGKTGYPMVDAGMRELNATGYMHNRVRMVVASFLTKHLLIDWRWGEAYFAEKLLDYEQASNVGGWQWAAGSGTDAAPYFRIFNPASQAEKFDADGKYAKKWIPELHTSQYPKPMVDHKMARERCLLTYKAALKS